MKISAVQSGLFKDVSGCLDAAALLVVTPPEGRTPIVITSLNAVDSATGRRSASAGSAPLNTVGADAALPLAADAAYVNWGGAWRMPTAAEFEALIGSTGTTEDDIHLASTGLYEGAYVGGHYLRIHGTRLRFPFCGRGDFAWWDYRGSGWNVNESFEDYGGYLSSTGSPRNPDSACILSFRYGFDAHGYSRALSARTEDLRHLGHCVRAVAE